MKDWWKRSYNEYPSKDNLRIYDKDVANHLKKHLRILDRFSIQKVVAATQYSLAMLSGDIEEPKKKNWKYYKDL